MTEARVWFGLAGALAVLALMVYAASGFPDALGVIVPTGLVGAAVVAVWICDTKGDES